MADLQDTIKKFSSGRNLLLLGAGVMFLAAIVVFLLWNQGPEYQVLYNNLSPEDSGAVIQKLKEKRIAYKVDGAAISVPMDKVYEMRMELAGEGLPQGGGIGFEIFDKSSFGVTDFVQKVNYKRALQGELARTISQIKEVETARVHLAIPDKGVFLDEQKKAKASVIVKLKPGKALSSGQVNSIVHLVANSYENMRPEDVTVVDTSGKMWTKGSEEDSPLRLTATQLEYKRGLEKDLETRIQTMLEKAVGANKVVARVSVDVDNKQVERTEETFDPDSQVIRSEQRSKEKTIGGSSTAGVPGVMSNLPGGVQPGNVVTTPAQTQKQDEVVNYEINKVISHVVEPQGSIKRVSVAVLVDGVYEAAKGADGKEVKKYIPRSDADIMKFTDMVKNTVGYSDKRGDVITVVSTAFEGDTADAGAQADQASFISRVTENQPYLVPTLIRYGTILVVLILVFIFIVRPIIARIMQERSALQAIEQALPEGYGARELPEASTKEERDQIEQLRAIVKKDPQQVASIIKSWIKER